MQTRESVQDTLASALSLRSPLRHIHGSTRKKCSLARSDFSQLVFACVHTDFGTRDLRGLWGQKHNPASARQTRVWNIFRSCYHATATDHRTDERISTGVHRPAPAVCVSQECSGKSPAATWNMLFRGLIPAFFFSSIIASWLHLNATARRRDPCWGPASNSSSSRDVIAGDLYDIWKDNSDRRTESAEVAGHAHGGGLFGVSRARERERHREE